MADLETPNPFFAPWSLIPALDVFAGGDVRLACVWADPSKQKLLGLTPLSIKNTYARLAGYPLGDMAASPLLLWRAAYSQGLCRKCVFEQIAQAACDNARRRKLFVRHRQLDAAGLAQETVRAGRAAGRFVNDVGAYERAALYEGEDPAHYLAGAIRKKKRKELNRLRNRLGDIGAVKFHQLTDEEQLSGMG